MGWSTVGMEFIRLILNTMNKQSTAAIEKGREKAIFLFNNRHKYCFVKEKNIEGALKYQNDCFKAFLSVSEAHKFTEIEGYLDYIYTISEYSHLLDLIKLNNLKA